MKEDQDQGHQEQEHTHELLLLPVKWMSSERKIMGEDGIIISKQGISRSLPDHQAHSSNGSCYGPATGVVVVARVCSDFSTTKTPLWRSGPQGPKSLCNACGIRQMKARRATRRGAAAAAAAAASGGLVPASSAANKVVKKERSEVDLSSVPFKKRFKMIAQEEEKDAAILLMALSCGIIHGY